MPRTPHRSPSEPERPGDRSPADRCRPARRRPDQSPRRLPGNATPARPASRGTASPAQGRGTRPWHPAISVHLRSRCPMGRRSRCDRPKQLLRLSDLRGEIACRFGHDRQAMPVGRLRPNGLKQAVGEVAERGQRGRAVAPVRGCRASSVRRSGRLACQTNSSAGQSTITGAVGVRSPSYASSTA